MKQATLIPVGGNQRLAAETWFADTAPARGVLVFVPGFGGDRHENGLFDTLAERAARRGFHSVQYDPRGIGESDGTYAVTTVTGHAAEFEAVARWAQERFPDCADRLSAVGFSLGAAVVGQALQRGEVPLRRAAYLSPAVRPNLTMWPRYEQLWASIGENGQAQKPDGAVQLGRPILESLRDTDLGPAAFDTSVPLLVCHGTADSRIPHTFSQELAQAVEPSPDFCYVEFGGASHSFRPADVHWPWLATTVTEWMML